MIALDAVKQMTEIERRAAIALQAYASGEDTAEFVTTALACLGAIFVEIHECEADDIGKVLAFGELINDVEEDRLRNIKVYFDFPIP